MTSDQETEGPGLFLQPEAWHEEDVPRSRGMSYTAPIKVAQPV